MGERDALMTGPRRADGSGMERTHDRRNGYQNIILGCIAGVLVLGMIERQSGANPALAQAQPESGGLSNALEQRKQIIAELRMLNSRLERIESKLSSGISVKVTDMPKNQEPKPKADRGEKAENKAEASVEVKPAPDGK